MPQILVVTNTPESADDVVLYQERIAPPDLESDHFSAQLIERLGWALVDADEAEHSSEPRRAGPASAGPSFASDLDY